MTFLSERAIKAVRKRHVCDACDKWIEVGEPAVTWCGLNDGQFNSVHYHPDCREAEVALNQLHDWRDYDDWMRLCEAEAEDRPWIKEKWPTPYLRLCMSRAQWAAHVGGETKA